MAPNLLSIGPEADLRTVQRAMAHSFLVKVIGRLGGDKHDLRELRLLNRVLRWTRHGIRVNANPRHQEILDSTVGQDARTVTSPGSKDKQAEE